MSSPAEAIPETRISLQAPQAPPIVLVAGSLVERFFVWWKNVDFLLSIKSERASVMLGFLVDQSWWLSILVAAIWLFAVRKKRANPEVSQEWQLAVVFSAIAFIGGVLVTTSTIGTVPAIITEWGGANASGVPVCRVVIDSAKLSSFRDAYKVVVLCGIEDPTADKLEDTRITVSREYSILPTPLTIVTGMSQEMAALIPHPIVIPSANPSTPPQVQQVGVSIWHEACIIPRGVDVSQIKKLSDVRKEGGKILRDGYF